MFGAEIRKLLFQVITSWQVIVVTVLLVMYIFLVNYVANIYYRQRRTRKPLIPRAKAAAANSQGAAPQAAPQQEDDELGLEDEAPAK